MRTSKYWLHHQTYFIYRMLKWRQRWSPGDKTWQRAQRGHTKKNQSYPKGTSEISDAYVARNATIFKNNHKGDRAFGSILHRRPVRPDSRFLSRSLFTIFEINPIIILLAYTNSNTDIDTGKRKFNSYSRYLKISEQKWNRTWWLFRLYDSNWEFWEK